ncbi:MAG: DUF1629 domain-containing protein, partial [Xanthobacteraceae bacterium]
MTGELEAEAQSQRVSAAGERKYYRLEADFSTDSTPYPEWINKKEQSKGLRPEADKPFRGFQFSEPPRIKFDRKGRRGALDDARPMTLGIWLISDRLKKLFERLDPEAFVFQKADVDYSNFPEPGPDYWFCYIMRVLDCVDEEHSTIGYQQSIEWKVYVRLIDVKMRPDVVGSAHAFRLKYASLTLIVDDIVVDTLKAEKIAASVSSPFRNNCHNGDVGWAELFAKPIMQPRRPMMGFALPC